MATCPLCGYEGQVGVRFTVRESEAAQHFVLREGDPSRHDRLAAHIGALWGADRCSVVGCPECRLIFSWPFVAGDAEFYNLAYPHAGYPIHKWEFSRTLEALSEWAVRGSKVLEIGAGVGNFLDKIAPKYFDKTDVFAIEYSDFSAAALRSKGYYVVQEDVRGDSFRPHVNSFDHVFMFQVLEHLDRLDELAARLRLITRPAANLFLAMPNPTLIDFNEHHNSLLDMPPAHISRWNERAVATFAALAGFEIVAFQEEPMGWSDFIKQDLIYAYLRRAQESGSFANRLRSKPRTQLRRAIEIATIAVGGFGRLGKWSSARNFALGSSIWTHLRRI